MCGIAGYVDFSRKASPEQAVLRSMARTLHHRGPDAQGILIDGQCGLAHARLSIIDLSGSPQPMKVPGANISLVFNGEIYNYLNLRRELEHTGVRFTTQGDTEVLLQWISREWAAALRRFDAMFGFAAWDPLAERLLLARDAIGEKPLFYATPTPGVIVFGSEIKALLEHPAVGRELDRESLQQVLRFRAVYGNRSLYSGINQLEPGTYLEFDRGGVRIGRFFDLVGEARRTQMELADLSDDALVSAGERLLLESIRERLVADVPVGAFLSGGLDSSMIVAAIRQIRNHEEEVRTFSVGFRNDAHCELPFARAVSLALGTIHTEVAVDEGEYLSRFCELTGRRDAPVSEPSDIAIAQMSRVAKQFVKVVLSGEGADEVFAGYPKYRYADASHILRLAMRGFGSQRVARMASLLGMDARRALIAARALAVRDEAGRFVQWFSAMDQSELGSLFPGLTWSDEAWAATAGSQGLALKSAAAMDPLSRMQVVDCLNWLPCNLLERGDRMTMAEGLELRPPFLDKALVGFGLALPPHMKIKRGTGKWIVRQWARRLLPSAIVDRKKWGFHVPLAQWFRGRMRPMLFDYVGRANGLCGQYGDRKAARALLDAHDSGKIDAHRSLWTLLAAEVWYQDVYLPRRSAVTDVSPAQGTLSVGTLLR
jgi:asparagine synthase (glutamine-hydrolysing)